MKTHLPLNEARANSYRSMQAPQSDLDTLPEDFSKPGVDPSTASLLSIIPGLGQLYVGEIGKGYLFLAVAALNALLLLSSIFHETTFKILEQVANLFHRTADLAILRPLMPEHGIGPIVVIYLGLLFLFVNYARRDARDRAVQAAYSGTPHPKFAFTLPEATSGSYLGHLILLLAFSIAVVFFAIPQQPSKQVVVIELMEPAHKPKPQPKPKAVQKPKVPPKIQKVVEAPKKVEPKVVPPPKTQPVAVAVPTKEPSPLTAVAPVASEPAPAATAANGSGTEGATGDSDAKDIDFGPYMDAVQRRIKKSWFPPKGNESKRIKVNFHISRNGSVSRLRMKASSGVQDADEAALEAVRSASPFPPLPEGSPEDIEINFTFDYNIFGGKMRSL